MKIFRVLFCVGYKKSQKIAVHPTTFFNVVSRTQHYPKFIPFVNKSKIIKTISPVQNYTQLTISYNNFKQLSYTSHVKLKPASNTKQKASIYSICHDDPLKKLESLWEIQPLGDKSIFVSYKLEFQFVSPFYMLASSVLKDFMGEQLWNLFKEQAIKQQVIVDRSAKTQQNNPLADPVTMLIKFLNKNPDIKAVYNQNNKIRQKIHELHTSLEKSPQYELQMKSEIKNILTNF